MSRQPVAPEDPNMRDFNEQHITTLLGELHRRGLPYGLLWGSASPGETTIDGHILVDFGNAPLSTLINLLHLLTDLEREREWDR
ncbi:hypothetical protein [Streptomyces sp. FH025]|uniref:hypothetical protein n=1 Tax=Streptomyces sp. FH025 TaxID=2815937 RepID=UPI001A9FB469|nr:hypothetical protein [Streptomyces sp. FH025]MBO1413311.1 hypothetical protein [Streptomyces sp. FH025]